jgi:GNAT superfamily N-acetyltransferase
MGSNFRLRDRSVILEFLETDRGYAGYAIGDLERGMFEQCDWYGARAGARGAAGRLKALVLVFHGFWPPVLFLMGAAGALAKVLPGVALPARVYLNCRDEHLEAASSVCTWSELTPMWRMVFAGRVRGVAPEGCIPLGPADAGRLARLYAAGGGEAFNPAQMEHGVYWGVVQGDRIVAAAGTHLVSDTHGVAAIGNVFTHPDLRGRGLGRAVTGAVLADLGSRGIRTVILNVSQSNAVAVRMYERLGFKRHCAFVEGAAQVREGL